MANHERVCSFGCPVLGVGCVASLRAPAVMFEQIVAEQSQVAALTLAHSLPPSSCLIISLRQSRFSHHEDSAFLVSMFRPFDFRLSHCVDVFSGFSFQ